MSRPPLFQLGILGLVGFALVVPSTADRGTAEIAACTVYFNVDHAKALVVDSSNGLAREVSLAAESQAQRLCSPLDPRTSDKLRDCSTAEVRCVEVPTLKMILARKPGPFDGTYRVGTVEFNIRGFVRLSKAQQNKMSMVAFRGGRQDGGFVHTDEAGIVSIIDACAEAWVVGGRRGDDCEGDPDDKSVSVWVLTHGPGLLSR